MKCWLYPALERNNPFFASDDTIWIPLVLVPFALYFLFAFLEGWRGTLSYRRLQQTQEGTDA